MSVLLVPYFCSSTHNELSRRNSHHLDLHLIEPAPHHHNHCRLKLIKAREASLYPGRDQGI